MVLRRIPRRQKHAFLRVRPLQCALSEQAGGGGWQLLRGTASATAAAALACRQLRFGVQPRCRCPLRSASCLRTMA